MSHEPTLEELKAAGEAITPDLYWLPAAITAANALRDAAWEAKVAALEAERDEAIDMARRNLAAAAARNKEEMDRATAAEARVAALEAALRRAQTVLNNMAQENENTIAFLLPRWAIHHEPLRADAKNLLPTIDAALGGDNG